MAVSATITAKGAAFRLECPSIWQSTPPETAAIGLSLFIRNDGAVPLRFSLLDTIRVELRDQNGTALPIGGGRNRTKPGVAISPIVTPGRSYTATRLVRLHRSTQSRTSLVGEDGFGGYWTADDLKPGKYRLTVHYEHQGDDSPGRVDIWQGAVQTPPLTFELH